MQDHETILRSLRDLYSQHGALPDESTGREWIARVCALIQQVDPDASNAIREGAQYLVRGLSVVSIGAAWNQMLQVIANVIANLEAGVYPPPGQVPRSSRINPSSRRILIGHGRASEWLKLRSFLTERLQLDIEEFNRESAAGYSTTARLTQMLDGCSFAFLVTTAEEERSDGTRHPRDNVIHEIGLTQGRYGFERAIVLLEEGCAEFSNIVGLVQIRFPKGRLEAASEEIRQVLEREGLLAK